jgi:hypothetical protein
MSKFMELLQSGDRKVQELVLSTICSTATAAGKEFMPYYPTILQACPLHTTIETYSRFSCDAAAADVHAAGAGRVHHSALPRNRVRGRCGPRRGSASLSRPSILLLILSLSEN